MSNSVLVWILAFVAAAMAAPLQNFANLPANNTKEKPLDTQFQATTGTGYNCTSPLTTWKSFSSHSEDIEMCKPIDNVQEINGKVQIISEIPSTEVNAVHCQITLYTETCYCGKWYNTADLGSCQTDVNNLVLNLAKKECEDIATSGSYRFFHQDSQTYHDFYFPINQKSTTDWFVTRGSWDAKWATCRSSDDYSVNGDIKTHHFQRNKLTFNIRNDIDGSKFTSMDGNEKINFEQLRILPNYSAGSYYDSTIGTLAWNVTHVACTQKSSLLYLGDAKLMVNSNGKVITVMINNQEEKKCMWLEIQQESFVCNQNVLSTNQEGKFSLKNAIKIAIFLEYETHACYFQI